MAGSEELVPLHKSIGPEYHTAVSLNSCSTGPIASARSSLPRTWVAAGARQAPGGGAEDDGRPDIIQNIPSGWCLAVVTVLIRRKCAWNGIDTPARVHNGCVSIHFAGKDCTANDERLTLESAQLEQRTTISSLGG